MLEQLSGPQMQMRLDQAVATDLGILGRYVGVPAVYSLESVSDPSTIATLAEVGKDFLYLSNCSVLNRSLSDLRAGTGLCSLKKQARPDLTVNRSKVEQIVLLADLNLDEGSIPGK